MRGAEAAERYFFEPRVLRRPSSASSAPGSARSQPGGQRPAAGAIAALSDGLLHYYLGGTAEAHLGDSPFKNVVEAMIELADELGVAAQPRRRRRPGDGLEDFKRGFANGELPFHTHEIVCDPGAYRAAQRGPRGRRVLPALPRLRS